MQEDQINSHINYSRLKSLQKRRIIRIIASACGFTDSLSNEHISMTPPAGIPVVRSVITEYNAPTHAPLLPSQYSGFGSRLEKKIV